MTLVIINTLIICYYFTLLPRGQFQQGQGEVSSFAAEHCESTDMDRSSGWIFV